jgi:AcrR family transcriptional regulator
VVRSTADRGGQGMTPMAMRRSNDEEHRGLPRGRSRLPEAMVQRDQRQRILRAMVETVAEKGYAAATVGEVVARARVSRSSFYAQFSDKENCFVTASAEGRGRLFARVRKAARGVPSKSPAELRLRAALRAYLTSLRDEPALATVLYVEWLGVRSRGVPRLAGPRQDFAAMTAAWHAQARRSHPGWPEVPPGVFVALIGATEELVREQVWGGHIDRLPELEEVVVAVHLRLLTDISWSADPRSRPIAASQSTTGA